MGCGAIVEFHNEAIERAQQAIYRANGYVASGHRLELRGYCPSCSRKQKVV
jgi:Fur family ferric uptake transcriptional regulator